LQSIEVHNVPTETVDKPKRNPEFTARLLPDGYVLIHSQKTDWVHTLTPVGGLVWEFCDGDQTGEQIAARICAVVQVAAKREDVFDLIKQLENNGLLDLIGNQTTND
jgi:hypothetical protein